MCVGESVGVCVGGRECRSVCGWESVWERV